ncbi:hypothetical protein F4604DRAFT_1802953, partial [Suillus subluteus]
MITIYASSGKDESLYTAEPLSHQLAELRHATTFHLFGLDGGYMYVCISIDVLLTVVLAPADHCKNTNQTDNLQSHGRNATMVQLQSTYVWMQFQNFVVNVSLIVSSDSLILYSPLSIPHLLRDRGIPSNHEPTLFIPVPSLRPSWMKRTTAPTSYTHLCFTCSSSVYSNSGTPQTRRISCQG